MLVRPWDGFDIESHFPRSGVYQALGGTPSGAALLAYTVPLEAPTTTNEKEGEIKGSLYNEAQEQILISCSHSALLGAIREA